MQQLKIIRASASDLDNLVMVSRQTFYETFHHTNTPENLNQYLNESFAEEKLRGELINPGSEFYFALVGQQVVGYLKVNRDDAQTEYKDKGGLEIERVYIIKDYWGNAIGQALLDYAMALATVYNATFVWLGVWEKNYRAIRFYEKNGFRAFDKHIFPVGDDPQIDILMRREL